jgi:hypothetical protein
MNELFELYKALYSDLELSIKELIGAEENFDYRSRCYLRAYASWVEGTIFMLKEIMRKSEYGWYKNLPIEKQLYLFEYDCDLKESGEPYIKNKKIPTLKNIKAIFIIVNEVFGLNKFSASAKEWNHIAELLQARDSITHPKDYKALIVSKKEILRFDDGRLWLKECFNEVWLKLSENKTA